MKNAIALVEVKNISKGLLVVDDMLKSANVEIIQAQAMCPGKFMIILGGLLADIVASVDKAKDLAIDSIIDSFVIGNVNENVFPALYGAVDVQNKEAMGIIETFTVASAIEAADSAAKAAQVELVEVRIARGMGGKSFVLMTGHVSDVRAAVEAGSRRAIEEGMLVNNEVIANPHPDVWANIG